MHALVRACGRGGAPKYAPVHAIPPARTRAEEAWCDEHYWDMYSGASCDVCKLNVGCTQCSSGSYLVPPSTDNPIARCAGCFGGGTLNRRGTGGSAGHAALAVPYQSPLHPCALAAAHRAATLELRATTHARPRLVARPARPTRRFTHRQMLKAASFASTARTLALPAARARALAAHQSAAAKACSSPQTARARQCATRAPILATRAAHARALAAHSAPRAATLPRTTLATRRASTAQMTLDTSVTSARALAAQRAAKPDTRQLTRKGARSARHAATNLATRCAD